MPIIRLPAHRTGPPRAATNKEARTASRKDMFVAPASMVQLEFEDYEYQYGRHDRYGTHKIWGATLDAGATVDLIHEENAWVLVRKILFADALNVSATWTIDGAGPWSGGTNAYFKDSSTRKPFDEGFILAPGQTCSVYRQHAGTVLAFGGLHYV